MKQGLFRILLVAVIIMVNIGCDQATKHLAKEHLRGQGIVPVVGSVFILRYTENRGAFLSIFSDLSDPLRLLLLIILPTVALAVMAGYAMVNPSLSRASMVALSCLVGGGASNLIDRYANNQQVIDFMNFGIGSLRTGILNVADLSITFGAIAMMYFMYREQRQIAKKDSEPNKTV